MVASMIFRVQYLILILEGCYRAALSADLVLRLGAAATATAARLAYYTKRRLYFWF